jgi:hypothetical protein
MAKKVNVFELKFTHRGSWMVERARGGKDSTDHAPNAHDDLANSVAGVVAALASSAHGYDSSMNWVGGPEPGHLSLWQHPYFNSGRFR